MELYFLGTGAGTPSTYRNVTSIVLKFEDQGSLWLFDCGEGTQQQILRSPIKLSKLEQIFITHLHGDHLFGLPGLLTTRSNQGVESPLKLNGPPGIKQYVETSLSISGSHLIYPLEIKEIEVGMVFTNKKIRVEAALLDHRIESYGYRITESTRMGRLNYDKLQKLNIPEGPLYGQLKQGIDIQLSSGLIVKANDVLGPNIPGRIVTILGDTKKCEAAVNLAKRADVVIHEATFSADLSELAYKYYHSTTEDAAQVAKEAGAAALILTHISSRYPPDKEQELLKQAAAIFPNSFLAQEFWSYPIYSV
jgi:ribonuclease Z